MTNPLSCEKAISTLRAILNGVSEPGPEIVSHWKECPHCSNVLRNVLQELEGLEASMNAPVVSEIAQTILQKSEDEVRRLQRRRLVLASSVALLVPLVSIVLGRMGAIPDEWAVALVAGTTAIALSVVVLLVARLPRRWEIYRRLGLGRELGGVCLGLAERTHTSVLIWRLAFLASIFLGGYGMTIYLLLLIAMPVHPDDRQFLLRFRLAHWWRGRRARNVAA